MTQETITTTSGGSYERLTAAAGCYLTQTAETDITARVFCTQASLAKSQTADYWTEIDAATYAAYQEELAAAIAAQEETAEGATDE